MTFGDTEFAFRSCDLTELKCINSGVSPVEIPNILLMIIYVIIIVLIIITIIFFSNSCDKTIDENILNLTNCK